MASDEIILQAEHLTKIYKSGGKKVVALEDVCFELRRGETLGIVGESGGGKSTIAKLLTRLEPVTDGKIFLKNTDITETKGAELRRIYRDVQMVFQMPAESFDPRCTLGDGIGESLRNMGKSRTETRTVVEKLLINCGLGKEYGDCYPYQVSGGQCQRAAIARALAVNPSILICDEATSALDKENQQQIVELLLKLKKERGLSIIFISHDMFLVEQICNRVICIKKGKII